ncbi:MAG: hypothetical protein C0467_23420 [Planctomycetaceae bacterium]|nr:hypothetical protein [Planctomycetaceae bacterium]
MFANVRVLVLAALVAAGLVVTSGPAEAQHRRAYGGVYSGGYAPSYYHGGYIPSYYSTPSYVYPAAGFYSGGVVPAYYQPYSWHAGAVYTPTYYGSYYHVGPTYTPYYRGYIIRH